VESRGCQTVFPGICRARSRLLFAEINSRPPVCCSLRPPPGSFNPLFPSLVVSLSPPFSPLLLLSAPLFPFLNLPLALHFPTHHHSTNVTSQLVCSYYYVTAFLRSTLHNDFPHHPLLPCLNFLISSYFVWIQVQLYDLPTRSLGRLRSGHCDPLIRKSSASFIPVTTAICPLLS